MPTLRAMERQLAHYRKQWETDRKHCTSFAQQICAEQLHNRIEEALSRCSFENEVLVRKVYLEGMTLHGMSKHEQQKRKKAGLKQFFDCLSL